MNTPVDVPGLRCGARGRGPVVLLIHAGVADSDMWDREADVLSDAYRVVRFDLRGFGESAIPDGPYCHHEDAASVLHADGAGPAHVVGASFGGAVAVDLALAHPELVRGLVLVAPALSGWEPSSPEMLDFLRAEDEALGRGDLEAATEVNLRMWVDGPGPAGPGPAGPGTGGKDRSQDPSRRVVRERVRRMQRRAFSVPRPEGAREKRLDPPAWDRLGEIRCPVLVVVGDRDVPEMGMIARRLLTIPGSRRVVVPGTGHLPSLEAPEVFERILREELGRPIA